MALLVALSTLLLRGMGGMKSLFDAGMGRGSGEPARVSDGDLPRSSAFRVFHLITYVSAPRSRGRG